MGTRGRAECSKSPTIICWGERTQKKKQPTRLRHGNTHAQQRCVIRKTGGACLRAYRHVRRCGSHEGESRWKAFRNMAHRNLHFKQSVHQKPRNIFVCVFGLLCSHPAPVPCPCSRLSRDCSGAFSGTRTHQLSDYAKFAVNDTTQRSANCLHLTTKPQPIRGIEDGMCACTRGREMIQSCDSRTHRHAYERASGSPVGLGDSSRASNSALSKWRASMTGVGDAVDNSRLACKHFNFYCGYYLQ